VGTSIEDGSPVFVTLDASTGVERARARIRDLTYHPVLALQGSEAFLAFNLSPRGHTGFVRSYDADTGAMRWESQRMSVWPFPGGALAAEGDMLWFSNTPVLLGLDRASGAVRWQRGLSPFDGFGVIAGPSPARLVIVAGTEPSIRVFHRAPGVESVPTYDIVGTVRTAGRPVVAVVHVGDQITTSNARGRFRVRVRLNGPLTVWGQAGDAMSSMLDVVTTSPQRRRYTIALDLAPRRHWSDDGIPNPF
jgi:hypothetical protein